MFTAQVRKQEDLLKGSPPLDAVQYEEKETLA